MMSRRMYAGGEASPPSDHERQSES